MTAGPRARLIAATIGTVQEHGVHAAGLSELLKRGNASRNSLYQHFPAGKTELVETAARIVSRLVYSHVSAMADALVKAPTVEGWLDELFGFWREALETSDYRAGSFMMAAALDELNPRSSPRPARPSRSGPPAWPTVSLPRASNAPRPVRWPGCCCR